MIADLIKNYPRMKVVIVWTEGYDPCNTGAEADLMVHQNDHLVPGYDWTLEKELVLEAYFRNL